MSANPPHSWEGREGHSGLPPYVGKHQFDSRSLVELPVSLPEAAANLKRTTDTASSRKEGKTLKLHRTCDGESETSIH